MIGRDDKKHVSRYLNSLCVQQMACLAVEIEADQPNGQATAMIRRIIAFFLHLVQCGFGGFIYF